MRPVQPMKPIDLPSMHEELQFRLKEYIIVNKLKANDPLPTEAQLAEQLGVSRVAVREGLRSLESLGLIYSRRGEGRYVKGFNLDPILENLSYSLLFDAEDVCEMIEVRRRLEVGFMREAIAAMDDSTVEELRGLVEVMRRRATAGEYFLDRDMEFHATIYRNIGNQVLLKLLDIFFTIYKNLRDRSLLVTRSPIAEAQTHEEIFAAIEQRNAELAARLMGEHLSGVLQRIQAAQASLKTEGDSPAL